ncbi:MAG TPA: aspartate aminotransferase family protein [Chloroflexota bacterium]|nr:aspartate aminotransferase family protein [Chloroflexota bacterium]
MSQDIERIVLDFMQMRTFAKDPFIFESGQGIRITDTQGKEYIDGLSGVFVSSLGYANPAVIEAVTAQIQKLHFAPPLHGTTPVALELVDALLAFAPKGTGAVKLLSGGSEATEAAMKLARQYHANTGHARKFKIIARYGGYHGATMGALSASGGWERKSVFEPLVAGFLHVHPPHCYRCPFDQVYGSCGITCAKLIERTIQSEDPETVAAVIMEPISISSAGFVVPPPEFFQILRETCDKHNVLLIFDEIITGFGRLGTNFGADYYGVTPDLLCCGKGMSGGYAPLAAVLIQQKVWDAFLGEPEERKEFHHGHTFGGNPVACAAGLAALKEITDRNLVANAKEQGAYLRRRLDRMVARFPFIGEARGAGLLQGLDFAANRQTREPFPPSVKPGKVVERLAKERGLLMRTGNDFAAFSPPLIVTRADVDAMCDILEDALVAAEKELPLAVGRSN